MSSYISTQYSCTARAWRELIPRPAPNAPPPTPMWVESGRGAGGALGGRWMGWGIGRRGIRRTWYVHVHTIHMCWFQSCGGKIGNSQFAFHLQPLSIMSAAKSIRIRRTIDYMSFRPIYFVCSSSISNNDSDGALLWPLGSLTVWHAWPVVRSSHQQPHRPNRSAPPDCAACLQPETHSSCASFGTHAHMAPSGPLLSHCNLMKKERMSVWDLSNQLLADL
jgi:hypothetical protein